ncbi:MAG: HDOD domain-containing protein [Gammaproteobacteria bacterium]|nr:HDOD domain-containing protein [Gammaproteobacteria bacterium]
MYEKIKEKILIELIDELESDTLVLPSLPEVALRVKDIVDDPNATSKQLAEAISSDAALATRLIQLANSPLLRGGQRADSLNMAITRMGNSMVKNCVHSLLVKQMFQPKTKKTELKFQLFWAHSTEVAAISFSLATMAKLRPDEALLAGLIHDIGALPIMMRAENTPELLENSQILDEVIDELHPRLGKEILRRWDFPSELVAVAAEHENLACNMSPKANLIDVVTVANLQSYIGKNHRLSETDWNNVPAFAKLNITTNYDDFEFDEEDESIKEVQQALRG